MPRLRLSPLKWAFIITWNTDFIDKVLLFLELAQHQPKGHSLWAATQMTWVSQPTVAVPLLSICRHPIFESTTMPLLLETIPFFFKPTNIGNSTRARRKLSQTNIRSHVIESRCPREPSRAVVQTVRFRLLRGDTRGKSFPSLITKRASQK